MAVYSHIITYYAITTKRTLKKRSRKYQNPIICCNIIYINGCLQSYYYILRIICKCSVLSVNNRYLIRRSHKMHYSFYGSLFPIAFTSIFEEVTPYFSFEKVNRRPLCLKMTGYGFGYDSWLM